MNPQQLDSWVRRVLDPATYDAGLSRILDAIPRTSHLSNVTEGTPILIRADLDVPMADDSVEDPSRLASFADSISLCMTHKWIPVLFGHVGRNPKNVAAPIALALENMHGQRVIYVRDWFDEDAVVVTGELREAIARATVGDIVLLENTRKYDFETALWDFDLSTRRFDAERLHAITASFASVVRNYMFDALAASNPDWSSVVVPAYMDRVAISEQIIEEFRSHVIPARKAEALVFSGLKMDKLVDLDAILREGRVRLLIIGGALAMPFRRALTNHDGLRRGIGLAESATEQSKPYYVKNQDVRLAQQILRKAHEKEVEVVLPEDFILDNGDVASDIPEGRLQMDIGPESARKFEAHLIDFVRSTPGCVVFYNGVMGKFEDARFAAGTRRLIASLRKITEDGARTYVGGGEGLLALERYGDKSWVTHAFTAGGTILKAMSGRVIGYLSALARYERLHVTEEETRWST